MHFYSLNPIDPVIDIDTEMSQPKTFSFLVVAPDYADALGRRNAAKTPHSEHMGQLGKAGILRKRPSHPLTSTTAMLMLVLLIHEL